MKITIDNIPPEKVNIIVHLLNDILSNVSAESKVEIEQCDIHVVMQSTLEMKLKAHKSVCAWFEIDHDKYTYNHNKDEMTKNQIELNAQIKLLRHLISM